MRKLNKTPRLIGDEHVKSVHQALLCCLNKKSMDDFPNTVTKTVQYIITRYPNVESVTTKFETVHPDQGKDLTLYLSDHTAVPVNLFTLKKGSKIQPKNPGAKSFLNKYFLSDQLQEKFNLSFEKNYFVFLQKLVEEKIGSHNITDKRELRSLASTYYPEFTDRVNPYREHFLYSLRETCFHLLKDSFNANSEELFHAYNDFFMPGDFNVITFYGKDSNDVSVDEFKPGTPYFGDIQIYKIGKSTVGIRFGKIALTLRFKFESKPTSSIKLAVSYESFPDESENELINKITIQKVET